MIYSKEIKTKDGGTCLLRNAEAEDATPVLKINYMTHAETDFLKSCPEECSLDFDKEKESLEEIKESDNSVMILATIIGFPIGAAGIFPVSEKKKVRHRATLGIGILKSYWGKGIGRAMVEACIECAKKAGYKQLELNVVSNNTVALNLYKSLGFKEYGRNEKGFCSPLSGWQELILMKLDLE